MTNEIIKKIKNRIYI